MIPEYTTIKVTKDQRDFIQKTAKKHKVSSGELAYKCVEFSVKKRYDPFNPDEVVVSHEVKKLKDQLISFIRKQDSD